MKQTFPSFNHILAFLSTQDSSRHQGPIVSTLGFGSHNIAPCQLVLGLGPLETITMSTLLNRHFVIARNIPFLETSSSLDLVVLELASYHRFHLLPGKGIQVEEAQVQVFDGLACHVTLNFQIYFQISFNEGQVVLDWILVGCIPQIVIIIMAEVEVGLACQEGSSMEAFTGGKIGKFEQAIEIVIQ